MVEALGNVGRLLLDGDEDVAGLVVKALVRVVVTDALDRVTDDALVVDVSLGRDLAKDHDLKTGVVGGQRAGSLPHSRRTRGTHETSLGGSLASDLGPRVLGEAGVEDGITDLVGNLVGVTLADRLGYTRGRIPRIVSMRAWTDLVLSITP